MVVRVSEYCEVVQRARISPQTRWSAPGAFEADGVGGIKAYITDSGGASKNLKCELFYGELTRSPSQAASRRKGPKEAGLKASTIKNGRQPERTTGGDPSP